MGTSLEWCAQYSGFFIYFQSSLSVSVAVCLMGENSTGNNSEMAIKKNI